MSAISQFLLVAWLSPDDFGLYASANAALIALVSLTNLGEVNAFLAGKVSKPSELLRTTSWVNGSLALVGCVVASVFYLLHLNMMAAMIALVALGIPLTGGSLSWNALAIRGMKLRIAVLGQFSGAAVKLLAGVFIAATTGSAIALPVALAAGAATNIATTRWMLRRDPVNRAPEHVPSRSRLDRARWGAQSLVQFFGAQCDYLVLAVVATPHLLGIYFLAYQATVGVSALVSGPLLKSGLVELGRSKGADLTVVRHLGLQTSSLVAVLSALSGAGVMLAGPYFPGAWSAAGAPLAMLLGSLPGRLLTPVLEAQLLAAGQVNRSFWINGADIIGTTLAAFAVVTGDVFLVAVAVSAWKITVTLLRCLAVFNYSGIRIALPALVSLSVHAAVTMTFPLGSVIGAASLATFGSLVVLTWYVRRNFIRRSIKWSAV